MKAAQWMNDYQRYEFIILNGILMKWKRLAKRKLMPREGKGKPPHETF